MMTVAVEAVMNLSTAGMMIAMVIADNNYFEGELLHTVDKVEANKDDGQFKNNQGGRGTRVS